MRKIQPDQTAIRQSTANWRNFICKPNNTHRLSGFFAAWQRVTHPTRIFISDWGWPFYIS